MEETILLDLNGILEVDAVATASGRKATFVVTRHAQNMSQQQIQDALLRMQQLKSDPREDQGNRYLLKKGERLYRELSPDLRQHLESLMTSFEEALETQDPSAIEVHRDMLETFLQRFETEA